ncbi:ABC transporter permease [Photobacterium aquae]|nr:thiamine ABC transporter permease [Photobacterium aquae]
MAKTLRQPIIKDREVYLPIRTTLMIRFLFFTTLLICFSPLVPGLLGIILPAFSWLPALGYNQFSPSAFELLIHWPNLAESIGLTLFTGLGSTLLAIMFSYWILATYWETARWNRVEKLLSPMLAMPHVAFAIGFALLMSPTGWFYRVGDLFGVNSTDSTGLIQDPHGLGLLLALAIKETPFLLIMSVSVLQQLNIQRLLAVSSALGYTRSQCWYKVVLPQWLPKMRLSIFAIAAYGLSVVDVAMILGPTRPTTLSLVVWQWFNEPDLTLVPRAAAGAILMLAVTALGLGTLGLMEWLGLRRCRNWQTSGPKPHTTRQLRLTTWRGIYLPFALIPALVLPILVLWSFAQRWRFPDLLPSRYSGRFWHQELDTITELLATSLGIAILSCLAALIMAIACLEYRQRYLRGLPTWLIGLPLIIPQLSLLFGIQILTYLVPGQHYLIWVVWGHLLFVFPYVYLALDGAWRSYDIRLDQCSRSLGLNGWQTWWKVKRPLVQPAIFFAVAVGLSVSLAQYLPTQLLGAGRISTLTTEAIALSSGQDRRVMAIYGLLQGLLPLLFFAGVIMLNHYRRHDRSNRMQSKAIKPQQEYKHG